MQYRCLFPNHSIEKKFEKALTHISQIKLREEIMRAIEGLENNPRPFGAKPFKQLTPPIQCYQFAAQYRLRIGDYRILYDVDDDKKNVWILALRKRNERTYR